MNERHALCCDCSGCLNVGGGDVIQGAGVTHLTAGGEYEEKERVYSVTRKAKRAAK